MKGKVLIVEDDPLILDMVKRYLERDGFKVYTSSNGRSAREKFDSLKPDVVILDLMLPDEDGFELCKEFSNSSMVLILTAKDEEEDKIVGLEIGADDYMTKPFNMRELVARVKALLRRRKKAEVESVKALKVGELELNEDSKSLYVKGSRVELTLKEYKILKRLMENAGRVVSRQELIDELYSFRPPEYERIIDTYIYRIRTKIMEVDRKSSERIKTVRGFGYKVA